MSVVELKEEAIRQFARKVEATDDERVLIMIVEFLNGLQVEDSNQLNLSQHYDKIRSKYSTVLKKLAA